MNDRYKHVAQWTSTLTTYAYPSFGDLPTNAIDTGLVLGVLEPIWTTKTETASRVRGRYAKRERSTTFGTTRVA